MFKSMFIQDTFVVGSEGTLVTNKFFPLRHFSCMTFFYVLCDTILKFGGEVTKIARQQFAIMYSSYVFMQTVFSLIVGATLTTSEVRLFNIY